MVNARHNRYCYPDIYTIAIRRTIIFPIRFETKHVSKGRGGSRLNYHGWHERAKHGATVRYRVGAGRECQTRNGGAGPASGNIMTTRTQALTHAQHAKSGVVVTVRRRVVEAERGPTVGRAVAPTAATQHAVGAGRWAFRVPWGRLVVVSRIVPIGTPLPYIPVHVVQSPGVWFFLSHGMRFFSGITSEPGVIGHSCPTATRDARCSGNTHPKNTPKNNAARLPIRT